MCMHPTYIQVPKTGLSVFPSYQRFVTVPCGKCDECRVSHAKEWAVRCMCEYYSRSEKQKKNCWFVTLTYDNVHNRGVLVQRDMQLFLKRLRKKFSSNKIKYFYCGEYGTETMRPHYHMIVYNVPLNDLVQLKVNFAGDILYTSRTVEELWGNGIVSLGALTMQSAAYTARYALKKNTTDCYMRCSNGFGKKYFLDHYKEIISNGYVSVLSGNKPIKAKIPKYFLKLYRKLVGDEKYIKFVKRRMHDMQLFNDKVEKTYKVNEYMTSVQRKSLGVNSQNMVRYLTTKRILASALNDLYKQRDFTDF